MALVQGNLNRNVFKQTAQNNSIITQPTVISNKNILPMCSTYDTPQSSRTRSYQPNYMDRTQETQNSQQSKPDDENYSSFELSLHRRATVSSYKNVYYPGFQSPLTYSTPIYQNSRYFRRPHPMELSPADTENISFNQASSSNSGNQVTQEKSLEPTEQKDKNSISKHTAPLLPAPELFPKNTTILPAFHQQQHLKLGPYQQQLRDLAIQSKGFTNFNTPPTPQLPWNTSQNFSTNRQSNQLFRSPLQPISSTHHLSPNQIYHQNKFREQLMRNRIGATNIMYSREIFRPYAAQENNNEINKKRKHDESLPGNSSKVFAPTHSSLNYGGNYKTMGPFMTPQPAIFNKEFYSRVLYQQMQAYQAVGKLDLRTPSENTNFVPPNPPQPITIETPK